MIIKTHTSSENVEIMNTKKYFHALSPEQMVYE